MTPDELDAIERDAKAAAHANGHAQAVLRLAAELRETRAAVDGLLVEVARLQASEAALLQAHRERRDM